MFKTKYASSVNSPMTASLRRLSYKGSLKSPKGEVLMTVYAYCHSLHYHQNTYSRGLKNNQILKLKTDDG